MSSKLNQKHFHGLGSEYIKIYRCSNRIDEFCGETEPIKPYNYNAEDHYLERLAEKLVSLVYGCIFQSYFTQSPTLNYCLDLFGVQDMYAFAGAIGKHKLGRLTALKLELLYREHYKDLLKNKSLEKLIDISYESFIIPNDKVIDEYFVNLVELDTNLEDFLIEFSEIYCKLVNDFNKIIEEYSKN